MAKENGIPAAAAWLVATLAVACLLPSLATAARVLSNKGFVVEGRVFCDTCQTGYQTPLSTYVAGAKVRVECRSKATGAKTCNFEGATDHTGTYSILVADEHEHEHDACETVLVSSPMKDCATVAKGVARAPVFLTSNNGIASNKRLANSLGFTKDTPVAGCAQLLQSYQLYEEGNE